MTKVAGSNNWEVFLEKNVETQFKEVRRRYGNIENIKTFYSIKFRLKACTNKLLSTHFYNEKSIRK